VARLGEGGTPDGRFPTTEETAEGVCGKADDFAGEVLEGD